jgi:hypothetical protein
MSIEQRLRNGLSANTEHLQPYLEKELDRVVQRAHLRRRVRAAGVGVAVAAVAAGVLWLPGVADSIRADDGGDPAVRPTQPTDATDEVQVLDSDRGSPENPVPLEAGRYAIPFFGAEDAPWGEVTVPTGWAEDRLHLATGPALDPHLRRVELLAVNRVSPDPCEGLLRPVEAEVPDIVAALTEQRTVRPSDARPVSIDGYSGQLVQFRVPSGPDIEQCGQSLTPFGFDNSWTSVFAGWSYRVWVLDVEGDPLVILAAHGPETTPTELAALTDMVEGLRFIDPRGRG